MERQISESQWSRVRSEIQRTWSGLNAADLEKTRGDVSQISELLEKKFGIERHEIERKLEEMMRMGSREESRERRGEELPRHRDMGSSSSASSRGDWEEGSPRQDFSEERHRDRNGSGRESYKEEREGRHSPDGRESSGRSFSGRDSGRDRESSERRDSSSSVNPQVHRNERDGKESGRRDQRH